MSSSSFVACPPAAPQSANLETSGALMALAIFDRSGILEGCEVCGSAPSQDWTNAAFHTIGLKKLLTTCLKQHNFEYAKVSAESCTTFILRRRHRYIAIVSNPQNCEQEVALAQLMRKLSLAELIGLVRQHQLAPVA